MILLRPVLLVFAVIACHGVLHADSCRSTDKIETSSKLGRFTLRAHFDTKSRSWQGRLEDRETKDVAEGTLEKIGWHTHMKAFVSDDGSRIVVFEPSAGLASDDRLLIYDRKFHLLKSLGLKDLLTPDEQGRVSRSISHVDFTEFGKEKMSEAGLEQDGQIFAFRTMAGRTVRVDLVDLVVFPPPKTTD